VFPLRLLLRKVLRPVERTAWRRYIHLRESGSDLSPLERGFEYWLQFRMRLALELRQMRYSLNYAIWRLLRYGLPLTALLIAVNSIWGFSWYFNSENWASAVWQEVMKGRIDAWRQHAAQDVERDAIAAGIVHEKVFAIEPEINSRDFSFIVIGDTGEGDPSQMVLRDQLIAAGKRDEVKFLILSSDVIYPDGKMKDYETNFYLPFKGFEKPVYAIPGNHDWFDANEGFNANFLERGAAITTLRARLLADLKTNLIQFDERFTGMADEAERLRSLYRIRNGLQRAPYFEMHSPGFSVIAGDTGIIRAFDEKQKQWFEGALRRAGSNFKLVILGHPFYVAGRYTASSDANFLEIHELLKRYKVDAVMAGDTHDFEFYKQSYDSPEGPQEMLHFVNGGGGAYLSIGTAVAFPDDPDSPDFAFYPSTKDINAKLDRETPIWKEPFLQWMRILGGYPFDSEMVSGAFDFNRAPFFQSFLEVRVEPSQQRVRFLLYGVNGQLRWSDLRTGGTARPANTSDDDLVEFVVPMRSQPVR
jgi:calcineurin-like phosphoesterase family protein